ncbi:hypothetical protein [Kitasatospora sp. GP82]|uniref:DUF6907 domain-containing protein n=1 Tax=Kitasatospora sp. GP82 TaxID=3035089 RepID=UPI0024733724|nr:hypothetical protein [Kitasatospora sp. GP82]MDH6125955.1 hypothetical protein [Kitasatospora sp. GP82]
MRTVTIRLAGGMDVVVPEPSWCEGVHQQGQALENLFHEGPETGLIVATLRGPVEILAAALAQYPFRTDVLRRSPVATVLLDGAWYELGSAEVRELAAGLVAHAEVLRGMAEELDGFSGGGR